MPSRWMGFRRAVAVGCAAALAGLAAGCGGGPDTDAALRAVLDARAQAVLRHDETAFLGSVDPTATGFRDAQRQVFGNLVKLPIGSWSYRLQRTGAFPLTTESDARRRVAAQVELEYTLRGYDTAPVSSVAYLTMTERGGHWYVAAQTDGEATGRHTTVQPWDQGHLTVVTGRHSLVLGQGELTRYAKLADAAVPVVRNAWPGDWPGRAIIEVPPTEADMTALLGAQPSAYQGIAAVTTAELRGTGVSAPADRVIVNPRVFAGLSPLGQRVVLTHELTHVATRTATTPNTPLWLAEGFADWVGNTGTGQPVQQIAAELRADVRAGRQPGRLPSNADFGSASTGLPQAYEGAWLACRMVAEQWGSGALVKLYRAAGHESADAALHDTLGVGLDEFTARWRADVARELG
ncbi:basic secretory family protein [Streptantibioticus rubrisoli]|uniref:Basic secretory family protein n=1 Tax=Streptantibioticus rubrisoli TaxID=1387313 RepID=A0ABT1PLL4_9ACTN|nr:basic secretory family protein [Streptantibioticus rubrisoli]MCQ4046249.1 basic secretory family protein [Streptantibioticus rubrisoli]